MICENEQLDIQSQERKGPREAFEQVQEEKDEDLLANYPPEVKIWLQKQAEKRKCKECFFERQIERQMSQDTGLLKIQSHK